MISGSPCGGPSAAQVARAWARTIGAVPLDIDRNAGHRFCRHRHWTPDPEPIVSPRSQTDALRGSIDLLILKTLSLGPMHGWGISQRIQQVSKGALELNQGSLYPALQRLEKEGLVKSSWGVTENNRRARYYEITPAGRRVLGEEIESWRRFAAALEMVLRSA
nr:MAG: hypothetical protein DIU52_10660 [bacterium]